MAPSTTHTWPLGNLGVITLHSFTGDTLRLYYEPLPGASPLTTGMDLTPLFAALPDLRRHRCDNGRHRSFYTEAQDTEVAHLLEHVLIELLANAGQERARIQGATNLDEAPARYRVRVSGWNNAVQAEECIEKAAQLLER